MSRTRCSYLSVPSLSRRTFDTLAKSPAQDGRIQFKMDFQCPYCATAHASSILDWLKSNKNTWSALLHYPTRKSNVLNISRLLVDHALGTAGIMYVLD